ncbi:hypothetical protein PLESTB_001308000 [Pleodorina starrii]|uniref:Poly [ADP-ribose] polymerase n=1 Tax=Pleodorina starrii TaxID=330485 RepID=A0A9W6BTM3_9CHLO|nr:hypothetical protein PLESTM_002047800 [Pleodorina starrii]GLC58007.1 hypothetical protein PLESTB_001308000 [Pleodorina starrii]GLC69600.1 hypothetical protein PLESTF_000852900 [Pleodorina starrii]
MSANSVQELLAEIKAHPDGTDLLLTAFYTAAHHYRRSTICTPFPTEVFPPPNGTADKDFPALHRALDALPPVHSLLGGEDVFSCLPPSALALLKWLLLNPARRRRFSLTPLGDMVRQLRQRCGGGSGGGGGDGAWQLPALDGHNSPACILRALDGSAQAPFARSCIAYHGTHLENLHSIIHTGLQSMSGTRLQRTGANYGAGIYLSTNYDTAFSFCQPCASWPRSRFGTKLRALLVCEVDLDKSTTERGGTGGSAGFAPASSSGAVSAAPLPDTYLVVQRADAVRLLYVLLYCDASRTARPARVHWCTVMVVLYAAFLLGKALLAALKQHRY